MTKVRPLVPVQDEQGKNYAVGEEVDVDDATAQAWHAAGKVALIEDEQRNAQIAEQADFTERTKRDGAEPLQPQPTPEQERQPRQS